MIFEIMKDLRIGGLNPTNYDHFISVISALLRKFEELDNQQEDSLEFISSISPNYAMQKKLILIKHNLTQFNLREVSEKEKGLIFEQITKKIDSKFRFCWHPEASFNNCTLDETGNVKISSAHSIQKGKFLERLSEKNDVRQFRFSKFGRDKSIPIKFASTFWGFCNNHDKIFNPIENKECSFTDEQNFLFAYRAFVSSSHTKLKFIDYYDFGEQSQVDIINNKKIFDKAIFEKDYSVIQTDIIVLDYEYPLAVSSASDLDYEDIFKFDYSLLVRMLKQIIFNFKFFWSLHI